MKKISPLLSALGEAIAKKRLVAQMSQQQLAQASGVHRSYMSDVERGLRNITLATLENIAAALRTTSSELLECAYAGRQQAATADASAESSA